MNLLAWVQALNGTTLLLVIAGLLFIEEVGVPLPFAPGDLLLAIAGIAIAAGKVPAVEVLPITMAAVVGGAITGRELFNLLGWQRLLRVARPLHLDAPLERVSAILQRRGWRAVFTARLIPGLRVHSTQVAGVTGIPRRTFIGGLLPAAAVYIGAFVGLGAAFGRPILAVISQVEHQALPYGIALLVVLVLFLLLRGLLWREVVALGRGTWAEALVVRVDSSSLILIPLCIGLNFTGHALARELQLPLFLDSTGTILCGALAGPWVGGSVGLVTNLVSSNSVDPIAAPYAAVSFAIGFAAGLVKRQGWLNAPGGWLVLWPVCVLISVVVSTPINLLISDGRTGVALGDAAFARLATTLPLPVAALAGEAVVDLPDKLVAVVIAMLIYRGLPQASLPGRSLEIDLGRAFTFAFRAPRWPARLAVASLCLLFSWLLVPFLLFVGYAVEVSRQASRGEFGLPAWDGWRAKLKEGTLMTVVILVWNVPPILLLAGGDVVNQEGVVIAGNLLNLLVGLVIPAVWAEYLTGGFRAAFAVRRIVRRLRLHLGLTVVVGAISIVLPVLSLIGVVGLVVGVIPALAYSLLVGAYLFGDYAAVTTESPVYAEEHTTRVSARIGTG